MNISTPVKIAAIPAAAVVLLTLKYTVGHVYSVMIILAVILGIYAVVSSAKAKRQPVQVQDVPPVQHVTTSYTAPEGLPRGTGQQYARFNLHEARRVN